MKQKPPTSPALLAWAREQSKLAIARAAMLVLDDTKATEAQKGTARSVIKHL